MAGMGGGLDTARATPLLLMGGDSTSDGCGGASSSVSAAAAIHAAHARGVDTVLLGGGCFHNALLEQALRRHLEAAGLRCLRPLRVDCGDAGIALGQAWVASWLLPVQH